MTRVRMGLRAPVELACGRMEWRPRRHVDGADVVLPEVIHVALAEGVETFAEIPAGVWWVAEFVAEAGESRVVLVPDTSETVNYADLIDVDPDTLEPVGPAPVDAWRAAVQQVATAAAIEAATAALAVLAPDLLVGGRIAGRRLLLTDRAGDDVDAGDVVPMFAAGDVVTGAPGAAASLTLRGGPLEWFLDATLPKGDAGGLPFGQALPAGADLNTLTTSGRYIALSASMPSVELGYPPTAVGAGLVDVHRLTATAFLQEFVTFASGADSRVRFTRRGSGSGSATTWGAWRAITASRVDRAEGGPTFYAYDDVAGAEILLATHGTNLGTVDLNSVASVGMYRQPTGTFALASRNYPESAVGGIGVLEVVGDQINSHRVQRWTPYGNGAANGSRVFYQRRSLDRGVTWGEWRTFASQRIDKRAGIAVYTWDEIAGREQLTYADTGTLDVTALAVDALSASLVSSGIVYLERDARHVTIQLQNVVLRDAGTVNLPVVPIGFRSIGGASGGATANAATTPRRILSIGTDLRIYGGPAGDVLNGSIAYRTYDPFPTSSPGIVVNAPPSS